MGDHSRDRLKPRRKMLAIGLATTSETAVPSRADTHACSAHPACDLLTIVAGIHDGMQRNRVLPTGVGRGLDAASEGIILTGYHSTDFGTHASVTLPNSVSGTLVWKGMSFPLRSGE